MNKPEENIALNSLDDFKGWEEMTDEKDFFSQIEKTDDAPLDNSSKVSDPPPAVTSGGGKEGEAPPPPTLKPQTQNFKKDNKTGKAVSKLGVYKYLKTQGLIEIPEDEEEDIDEETAEEFMAEKFSETFEKKVNERIEELFNGVPEDVKQLNKFVINGGNPAEYFQAIAKSQAEGITEDIDLSKEKNQELVFRQMMEEDGEDPEFIENQIDYFRENGKLKLMAEKKFEKWKSDNEREKEMLLQRQRESVERQKEAIKQNKYKLSAYLEENDTLGQLSINKDDKRILPSYINDKTVRLNNGNVISQLQKDLYFDIHQNQQALLQLAVLMKNRNKDGTFNFNAIVNDAKTQVAKEVKDNVRRAKSGMPDKSKLSVKHGQKSLADYFD